MVVVIASSFYFVLFVSFFGLQIVRRERKTRQHSKLKENLTKQANKRRILKRENRAAEKQKGKKRTHIHTHSYTHEYEPFKHNSFLFL